MATRAAQLTFLIVKFVATAGAPAPMFALDLTRRVVLNQRGIRQRARFLLRVGSHSKLFGYIDARLLAVALRIFNTDLSDPADCRIEQHDVNVVMMLRLLVGPDHFERSTLHSTSTGPYFTVTHTRFRASSARLRRYRKRHGRGLDG
jgi:hypothetical protein